LGFRVKLDSIAEATLGRKKIGHGLEAIKWWRSGDKEKVMQYCLEDVKITKDIYEYALKNGHLKYMENGKATTFTINTSDWEKGLDNVITHTLPF
jgi:DEAD/DEAH box helicase domain-containing protein